jgi:hypothetical protein
MSMTINAVATSAPFDIKAALASPDVKAISRILAKAGIAKPTEKIKHSHLESCMTSAGIDPVGRMRCKIALDRAHLIDWTA